MQTHDPRFGFGWYTEPGALVSQLTITHGTVAAVHALHDFIDATLEAHATELEGHGGLFILHDMRTLTGHDPAARAAWIARMKRRKGMWGRGAVVAVSASPLVRMAAKTVSMMVVLATGGRLESGMVSDPAEALRRHGIVAPRKNH